jgi:hypothetical protein
MFAVRCPICVSSADARGWSAARLDGRELRVDAGLLAGDVARERAARRQERDEAGREDEREREAPGHRDWFRRPDGRPSPA